MNSKATLAQKLCYALAVSFLKPPLKRLGFRSPVITRFDSMENYVADRVSSLHEYIDLFDPFVSLKNKTVLELGCNKGYLLNSFWQRDSFTGIGAELMEASLAEAQRLYGDHLRFVRSTPTKIAVENESVDVVYTIDTVEHLSRPRDIFMEVYRILKPGGLCLIHFNPWMNPYGSHLEDIIPFPWPHALFSMPTLLKTAERLYDSPHYEPACYWKDARGQKVPNPYRDVSHWDTYLNYMTIRRFNRLLKTLPFEVCHQQRIGFGGKTFKVGKLFGGLAHVPVTDEFFCKALFTVLKRPLSDHDRFADRAVYSGDPSIDPNGDTGKEGK
jgi:SAM-dependent methyltransferase